MSRGLLDKKSCQPSFSARLQDKPFGVVDLQDLKGQAKGFVDKVTFWGRINSCPYGR